MIPTSLEYKYFVNALTPLGIKGQEESLEYMSVLHIPEWETSIATGGLGKVKFAVRCQYLLDKLPGTEWCFCLGAAGSLDDSLRNGDLVAGIETVVHDIRKTGKEWIPRYPASELLLNRFKNTGIPLHYQPIASGDEDIVSEERRRDLRNRLNCFAVAWEGAGAAEACHFSGKHFIEIRGISDQANMHTPGDFKKNVKDLMEKAAHLMHRFFSQ